MELLEKHKNSLSEIFDYFRCPCPTNNSKFIDNFYNIVDYTDKKFRLQRFQSYYYVTLDKSSDFYTERFILRRGKVELYSTNDYIMFARYNTRNYTKCNTYYIFNLSNLITD